MAIDLSIIIVSWNVRDLLRGCLRSVIAPLEPSGGAYRLGTWGVEILVVDNASADGSAEMVRAEFPGVTLIPAGANLGFVAANNLALRRATGRYYLLLNPDTVVGDGALLRMLEYLEAHPEVGLLGPRLRYGDGTVQSSRRRFPTLASGLMESTLLEEWFPGNRWARHYRMEDVPSEGADGAPAERVDWVNGSCMLVRGEAVSQVGLLDEQIFMYSEEVDWCRRLADAGWQVVYLPGAEVTHYEGRSSDQVRALRQIHFDAGKVHYLRKHHGVLPAEALRAALLATYVVRLGIEGAKWLIGHKRPLRRERLVAYLGILRSGLRFPVRQGVTHAE